MVPKRIKRLIKKASGEMRPFSVGKLRKSLQHSAVPVHLREEVVKRIHDGVSENQSTDDIYQNVYNYLKVANQPSAGRYKLKRALMELGPSGYPFELYVAELLKRQGWYAQTNQILQGKCVSHEVDVLAVKEDTYLLVECKFHNQPGYASDVKVPLYIQSRFLDVKSKWELEPARQEKPHEVMVVTNTRFTEDALSYGRCMGMHMLAWDFPSENPLRTQIEKVNLLPVTCIGSLTKFEKEKLLARKVVLCQTLVEEPEILDEIKLKEQRKATVLNEAWSLSENFWKRRRTRKYWRQTLKSDK